MRGNRIRRLVALVPLAALLCCGGVASATAPGHLRTVVYHGLSISVPRSWPVYDLAQDPQTCVRFNRHALYLGVPGSQQSCPAQAAGRTEAILIEPVSGSSARAAADPATGSLSGSATSFFVAAHALEVIATWRSQPQLVAAALHRRRLPPASTSRVSPRLERRSTSGGTGPSSTPVVYTGPGFDACDAPSASKMSAWTVHSPYHAIGVYIGGRNAACPPVSDPNLTPGWLSSEASAGWHFIPTYVGLQAPSNSCGCAAISASQASAEGTAAADDAVNQAQGLDLPSGTPIYDDMEYYSRTNANTSAVLAFLASWTIELHAKGYLSGVYGNANSAIADLATQYGTTYPEPDDIWFAAWPGDGSTSTDDPNIPSSDWENHQRLHQYSGAHNETYGGVTINIDGDYLDGATAGTVALPTGPQPPPSLSVTPAGGMTDLTASWTGIGLAGWQVLAGASPTAMSSIAFASLQGAQTTIAVPSAAPYFAVEAIGASGQVLATSATVPTPAHLSVFGHTTFFGLSSRVGAIPVGCYLVAGCHLTGTISVGHTTVALTAVQAFRSGGGGLLYYRLTSAGARLLARARGGHLPVLLTVSDLSGATTSARMVLIAFSTSGRSPARSVTPGLLVTATGTTIFVYGWGGGILTRCSALSACPLTASVTVGKLSIATVRQQSISGLELGYVYFSLTARGHQLLSAAPGNQLAATLVLRSGTSMASARIVLVRYS